MRKTNPLHRHSFTITLHYLLHSSGLTNWWLIKSGMNIVINKRWQMYKICWKLSNLKQIHNRRRKLQSNYWQKYIQIPNCWEKNFHGFRCEKPIACFRDSAEIAFSSCCRFRYAIKFYVVMIYHYLLDEIQSFPHVHATITLHNSVKNSYNCWKVEATEASHAVRPTSPPH